MGARVVATLGDKKVEVMMLTSDGKLTIYEHIDNETVSMWVICHIKKQNYFINEESGMIEIMQDNVFPKKLKIRPIDFDLVTQGRWEQ